MDLFDKIFGQKLFNYIVFLIVGVIFAIGPKIKPINPKELGVGIILIAVLGIIYEGRIRYYIKFGTNKKIFKSGKEAFIADYFDKKKIKYIYEKKLRLGSNVRTPDFYLPEFDIYVEYWGRWNSDFEYRKECEDKRKQYKQYDIPLVELYPDNLSSINQLDWKFTERLLNVLKKERA